MSDLILFASQTSTLTGFERADIMYLLPGLRPERGTLMQKSVFTHIGLPVKRDGLLMRYNP